MAVFVISRSRCWLAGLRGEKVGEEADEDVDSEDDEALWLWAPDDDDGEGEADARCIFAMAAAAALAALLMGTWMPKEGRESDLRRVLYGIFGEATKAGSMLVGSIGSVVAAD